jgi:hypothetical protein
MQFAAVKKAVSQLGHYFILLITCSALVLFVVSGFLYHQNSSFKKENRRLIIANDSIISVNIELKNALTDKNNPGGKKTASARIKE